MPEQDTRTTLYRHYDKNGVLLYVGISLCQAMRLNQHSYDAEWFADIANVTLEHFPTRQEAEQAEIKAIQSEKPLHNKAYSLKDAEDWFIQQIRLKGFFAPSLVKKFDFSRESKALSKNIKAYVNVINDHKNERLVREVIAKSDNTGDYFFIVYDLVSVVDDAMNLIRKGVITALKKEASYAQYEDAMRECGYKTGYMTEQEWLLAREYYSVNDTTN
jgi:hypothetical protein